MHRLFVALRPSAALRARLLALQTGIPGARWQDDDQLHLTLRFIGEVDRPVAEDVAAALDRVDGPRPTIAIRGAGSFDRRGVVHTLYAAAEPEAGLLRLQQRVDRAAALAGIAREARAFAPHITLARFGRGGASCEPFLARHAGLTIAPEECEWFGLFESRLGHEGASYDLVARYPLR